MATRTYLAWYRDGRMDEPAFRSVTGLLAECGMSVEHPALGCGMLLDVEGEQVKLPPRAHPRTCRPVGRTALHAALAVG